MTNSVSDMYCTRERERKTSINLIRPTVYETKTHQRLDAKNALIGTTQVTYLVSRKTCYKKKYKMEITLEREERSGLPFECHFNRRDNLHYRRR